MKIITIEIRELNDKSFSGSNSELNHIDLTKISLNQIDTLLTERQYKKVKKKLRQLVKIINTPT